MNIKKSTSNNHGNSRFVAHRGFTEKYPENTLLAIQSAIDVGAQFVEVDIQLSKDLQPVLFHDRDLVRLCNQKQSIHNYTLKEIQEFSNFSPDRFGDKYKGEAIPTLKTLVSLIKKYPEVIIFIELKRISIEQFNVDEMLKAVLPTVDSIINQCVFISYSLECIEAIRQQTSFSVGVVIDSWETAKTTEIKRLEKINPEYFFCDIESLPSTGTLSLLNCKLAVYECTDLQQAALVLQQGVELVETFDIKKMLANFKPVNESK